MPDKILETFAGRCPVCQAQMHMRDDSCFIVCPQQDFEISLAEWNRIWSGFDGESGDARKLLSDLLAANIAEKKIEGLSSPTH